MYSNDKDYHIHSNTMNRRGGVGPKLILLVLGGVLLIFALYSFHDLTNRLRIAEERGDKLKQQHESLSAQIQVVYEHKARLETSLNQEKIDHRKSKDDLIARKSQLETKFVAEKEELQRRIDSVNSEYKMIKAQHEDLQGEYARLMEKHSKLEMDEVQKQEQHNQEYQDFKLRASQQVAQLQTAAETYQQQNLQLQTKIQQLESALQQSNTKMQQQQQQHAQQQQQHLQQQQQQQQQQYLQQQQQQHLQNQQQPLQNQLYQPQNELPQKLTHTGDLQHQPMEVNEEVDQRQKEYQQQQELHHQEKRQQQPFGAGNQALNEDGLKNEVKVVDQEDIVVNKPAKEFGLNSNDPQKKLEMLNAPNLMARLGNDLNLQMNLPDLQNPVINNDIGGQNLNGNIKFEPQPDANNGLGANKKIDKDLNIQQPPEEAANFGLGANQELDQHLNIQQPPEEAANFGLGANHDVAHGLNIQQPPEEAANFGQGANQDVAHDLNIQQPQGLKKTMPFALPAKDVLNLEPKKAIAMDEDENLLEEEELDREMLHQVADENLGNEENYDNEDKEDEDEEDEDYKNNYQDVEGGHDLDEEADEDGVQGQMVAPDQPHIPVMQHEEQVALPVIQGQIADEELLQRGQNQDGEENYEVAGHQENEEKEEAVYEEDEEAQ